MNEVAGNLPYFWLDSVLRQNLGEVDDRGCHARFHAVVEESRVQRHPGGRTKSERDV